MGWGARQSQRVDLDPVLGDSTYRLVILGIGEVVETKPRKQRRPTFSPLVVMVRSITAMITFIRLAKAYVYYVCGENSGLDATIAQNLIL
jgi:hypothetical protein